MRTRKITGHKAIKREILIKELIALEKRLDDRFDIQTESLKDHIRSNISQVNLKIDNLDKKVNNLDKKLDIKVTGLVDLIERSYGLPARLELRVDDHERRIVALES